MEVTGMEVAGRRWQAQGDRDRVIRMGWQNGGYRDGGDRMGVTGMEVAGWRRQDGCDRDRVAGWG